MRTTIHRRVLGFLLALSVAAAPACGGGESTNSLPDTSAPDASPPDDTAEIQAALEGLMQSEVAQNDFLGLGATVRLADGRAFRADAGYSDPEHAAAYDVAATEQVIGSVSKLYTAVLAMQLVEEGAISLDDTINHWFTFPGADAITVRMLLKHTSGLGDYLHHLTLEQYGQPWTPEQLLNVALAAGPVGQPPLAEAAYSNTNFLLLGLVIEAETGKSWEQNIEERIVEPLGLEHTYYVGETEKAAALAGGWMRNGASWLDTMTLLDPSVGWAVGAVAATNEELMRFTQALFGGELFKDPATLTQMLSFDTVMDPAYLGSQPPTTIGLCVMRTEAEGLRLDGHVGHIQGYNAAALRDPDTGAFIVVTSNDDQALSGLTALKIAQYVRAR